MARVAKVTAAQQKEQQHPNSKKKSTHHFKLAANRNSQVAHWLRWNVFYFTHSIYARCDQGHGHWDPSFTTGLPTGCQT